MADTSCCCASTSCCSAEPTVAFYRVSSRNTLAYAPELCIGCGLCAAVCPHGVFVLVKGHADVFLPDACMECGACRRNCPAGAIAVESGVGCASAMIYAALTGRAEVTCGDGSNSCCGDGASRTNCC